MPDDLPLIPVGVSARATFSDSWGDGDRDPDLVHVDQGEVRLTPQITQTITDAADTPIIAKSLLVATFGSDGWARWEHETEGDDRWIYVYDLSSTRLNPHIESGATHRVEFRGLRARGRPVEITGGPVRITPDLIDPELGYVNLARLLPAPNATIVTVLGEEAITARAGAETARYGSEQARDESIAARDASREARDTARDHRDDADASAAEARSSAGGAHADAAEAARDEAEASATSAGQHAEAVKGWHGEVRTYRDAIREASQYMDTGWQDLTLRSPYTTTSWGHDPQWRVLNGWLAFRGIIERPSSEGPFAANHVPFGLSEQAAPLPDLIPTALMQRELASQSDSVTRIRIDPDGQLVIHAPPSNRDTPWISLDSLFWPIDSDAAGMVPAELLAARDEASAAATSAEGFRDEAQDAALAAQGLTGTGSPEGVVAAPPGTAYRDTAGTMGAWSWLKTSGTGTSGWTVVHGDTGWRDVRNLLLPGLAASTNNGRARIRRIGNVVHFDIKVDVTGGGITGFVDGVPNGFRGSNLYPGTSPPFFADRVNAGASQLSLGSRILVAYPDSTFIRTGNSTPWQNPGTVQATGSFVTPDAWPTSLPGSAV